MIRAHRDAPWIIDSHIAASKREMFRKAAVPFEVFLFNYNFDGNTSNQFDKPVNVNCCRTKEVTNVSVRFTFHIMYSITNVSWQIYFDICV